MAARRRPSATRLIAGLADGSVEVLTSCDLISEGLDVPSVGAVILLRPTQPWLCMQQIGRGMRPAPGKDALIVLDHVGNSLVHGLPETEIAWSLAGAEQRARRAPVGAAESVTPPIRSRRASVPVAATNGQRHQRRPSTLRANSPK